MALKLSIKQTNLRYKLLLINALVIVLPFLVISYIFYSNNIFLKPSQIVIVGLVLTLILSGLILLRQIFDKLSMVATSLNEIDGSNKGLIDTRQDTDELHGIAVSFNNLLERLEDTTSELQQRVFELFSIKELTEIASRSLDIDGLLNELLIKSMAVSKAQIGSVLMVESEKKRFRVVVSRGLESGPPKDSYINIVDSFVGLVVSDRKPLLVQDIETDLSTLKANDPKYGPPSFLSMPILVREDVIAVLNLSHKNTEETFESTDQNTLSIMIGEIGFAIENAILHLSIEDHLKDLQERTEELTNVNNQLQSEITERRQAEEQIRTSLKEKGVLLAEVHHRVKNNLQIISSMLDMRIMRTDNQQVIDLFEDARSKIHTMALIHSQLCESEHLGHIEMNRHIMELIGYLSQIYADEKRITPVVKPTGVYLSLNHAIPCALVINELVSNAFKHAFKGRQEGRIEVSLMETKDRTIIIKVKDNGIGFPKEIDILKTDTLGLKLVKSTILDQLKGELKVERDAGTAIIAEFKIVDVGE